MKIDPGVLITDQISLQNSVLPLSSIVQAMEGSLATAIKWGIPNGIPINVSHDTCRPLGWCEPRGVYLAKDMARQIGQFYIPETDEERRTNDIIRKAFATAHCANCVEPHADVIRAKVSGHATDAMKLWHREASAAVEPGLAAAMFPEFFSAESEHVDKDGLVDFAYLLSRTRQIQEGVFHEPNRDVLLFAHRFFRRSLSLHNSINAYVLRSFSDAAGIAGVAARLKLDPDLIGHPDSARPVMELEYWHGPKYDDDIACIPSGVATHKNLDDDRIFSGIDQTQIWWKDPEQRVEGRAVREIRTFQAEELIENESPGLADGRYGCRYAHAEYDLAARSFSHFDGAIRSYDGVDYLERIERRIDRAGKYSDYTKLFRLDGALPAEMWKQVLTDWYLGNPLIPEYLGAPDADLAKLKAREPLLQPRSPPQLSAFLCLEKADAAPPVAIKLRPDQAIDFDGERVEVAEIGQGRVAAVMQQWVAPDITTIAARANSANLACIMLPRDPPTDDCWAAVAGPLAAAISADAIEGLLDRIAVAICWQATAARLTLSIEGKAAAVGCLLEAAANLVQMGQPASEWAEPLRDALLKYAPELDGAVEWPGDAAKHGRLQLKRDGELTFVVRLGNDTPAPAVLADAARDQRDSRTDGAARKVGFEGA